MLLTHTLTLPAALSLSPCPALQALSSVSSTAFMAYRCVPPLRETVKGITDEQVQALQATVLKVGQGPPGRLQTLNASSQPASCLPCYGVAAQCIRGAGPTVGVLQGLTS